MHGVQEHDVSWRSESRVFDGLHQCILDAKMRSHLWLRRAIAESHAAPRIQPSHTPYARPIRAEGADVEPYVRIRHAFSVQIA